jgi:hypothetical protein
MRKAAIPLLLVVCSLVVSLLAFEAVLRVVGFSAPVWYQPDAELGWRMRPGLAAWYTREGHAFVSANRDGMPDKDHALEKAPGVYRIAVLGDSYSEAKQVSRDEAYWRLLPAELAACGFQKDKQIEVLNFGVSGFGTAQEYVVLESQAIRYSPDLVLLQFTNGNDLRDNSFALDPEKGRPYYMLGADGKLRMDESFAFSDDFMARSSLKSEVLRKATDKSRVLQLVRSLRETSFVASQASLVANAQAASSGVEQGLEPMVLAPPHDPVWEEAWRITEGLIAKAGDFAKRNGARFAVVTVPYAIQVHPDPKVRAALQARLGVKDLFYPDQRIAALAKKNGITAVTLAPEMQPLAQKSGTYYHGFENVGLGRGHWNAEGHRAAAKIIARRLCDGLVGARAVEPSPQ